MSNSGGTKVEKIAVIFGGPATEHDVSILTGLQTARELSKTHDDVVALYWTKTADWYTVSPEAEGADFVDGVPSNARPIRFVADASGGFMYEKKGLFGKNEPLQLDVVVNCCHGGPGEDGSLQAALDLAGIAYTGPDVAGAALGMDKLAFTGVMQAAGLPVLPKVALVPGVRVDFEGPYIVKPRFGGSSVGIEVVDSVETALRLLDASPFLRAGAVLEPYRGDSYDLNICTRTFPDVQLSAIEKPQRSAAGSQFLNYKDKYVGGEGMVSAPRELPADIPQTTADALRDMAARIATICNVRGLQRIDFLMDGVDLYVNEINTIPGSHGKHLWVNPDIPFGELLNDMIAEAHKRPARKWIVAGADGSALRSAGAIQGKLS